MDTAAAIYAAFRRYRDTFAALTDGARARFEAGDWAGVQAAGSERLDTYNAHVTELLADGALAETPPFDTWPQIKAAYVRLMDDTVDADLAETFFNSVYRKRAPQGKTLPANMFLHPSTARRATGAASIVRVYDGDGDATTTLRKVLQDFAFTLPWRNLDGDIASILHWLAREIPAIDQRTAITFELCRAPFFRNKGAYLIGRLRQGTISRPLALPVLRTGDGQLYVDALICDEDELSVMFSFTRAYFMVDTRDPDALVTLLRELLPQKKLSELYASVGLHKHGKTMFYRGFLAHLDASQDELIIAPGIRGMVMAVFALPSYQTVFKVIKDRFAPQKRVTPDEVRASYHIVKTHDRVGRMADTQEFEDFRFPKSRFSQALLVELKAVCRSAIVEDGEDIVIRHLYTERLMTPLNLYVESCSETELASALEEYGNAISELGAANIFAGDMLPKNFGVTRHGRVVFYDYDEISYLTDVQFCDGPPPEADAPRDPSNVYPTEFRGYLADSRDIPALFEARHGRLFDASYWRGVQRHIADGAFADVYPYRRRKRFGSGDEA